VDLLAHRTARIAARAGATRGRHLAPVNSTLRYSRTNAPNRNKPGALRIFRTGAVNAYAETKELERSIGTSKNEGRPSFGSLKAAAMSSHKKFTS
jgi:hypothetical protein